MYLIKKATEKFHNSLCAKRVDIKVMSTLLAEACVSDRELGEKSAEGNAFSSIESRCSPDRGQSDRQAVDSDILKQCRFRENLRTRKAKIDFFRSITLHFCFKEIIVIIF